VSAEPISQHDPDDPVEILRVLPERYHEQFRTEYAAAAQRAQRVEGYHELHQLLQLWRLRAATYAAPGYQDGLAAARAGDPRTSMPIERLLPDWDDRVRRHRRR